MDLKTTLAVSAVSGAVGAFCGWRGSRPWRVIEGPRLTPWSLLMLIAFAVAAVTLGQVVGELGLRPGPVR
jgi:hypothetical protein